MQNEKEKPRWIIILNKTHPKKKDDNTYYATLSSNINSAIENAPNKDNEFVCVLKGHPLESICAFSVLEYMSIRAEELYEKYKDSKLDYKGYLTPEAISYIDDYLKQYFSDSKKAITIPPKVKNVIF